MDEKIKISLPKNVLETLRKDCADFKVLKENGQPNVNLFINTLIVNYYESFSANEESLHNEIRKSLDLVPDRYKENVFKDVIKIFERKNEISDTKKETATFSFKPTKISDKAISFIENIVLQHESISSFYRRMFSSYVQKTKNEREKIIHKENYAIIAKAIKAGITACIETNKNNVLPCVSIFSVSPAKDELFNYVLGFDGKNNVTIRLASIKHVSLLSAKAEIPEKYKNLLTRQAECAPQYPMYPSDDEPIKVQLSEKGKKMFDKIYLYRPTPISIDGDIYTFNCSANQLLYYFERFGDAALIISPKKLGVFMRNYYYFALKKYKSLYKNAN